MWTKWDPATLNHDFAAISQLGGNAVRVNVFPSVTGFPQPSAAMEGELEAAVSLAVAHGLTVQLTLFDWWYDYMDISGSVTWARAVLAPFASSPAIAFIDLHNEITVSNGAAMSWAKALIPVIQQAAGSIPVTVSVPSTPATVAGLKAALGVAQPDFYDAHYYGPIGGAYADLAADQAIAAPRPLFIGETGYSTTQDPNAPTATAETNQALYLASAEWATSALGLPAAAPWTLQDFTLAAFPAAATYRPIQAGFGLLRTDGSAKPAAGVVSTRFATGTNPALLDPEFSQAPAMTQRAWLTAHPLPVGWLAGGSAAGKITWAPGVSASGGGSVELSGTAGNQGSVLAVTTQPAVVPTPAARVATAWAWVKGVGATGTNQVVIAWFGAGGNYLGLGRSSSLGMGASSWTRLVVTSSAPAGAQYARMALQSSGNTGAVWFSDAGFTMGR
jgi:hypothetical protein